MTDIYMRHFRLTSLILLSIVIPNRWIFKSLGRVISKFLLLYYPFYLKSNSLEMLVSSGIKTKNAVFHFATENRMIMKNAEERYGET